MFYLSRREVNYIYVADSDACSIIDMSSQYILTYIEKTIHTDINVNRLEGFKIIIICHHTHTCMVIFEELTFTTI
jgi:hypothetical protein